MYSPSLNVQIFRYTPVLHKTDIVNRTKSIASSILWSIQISPHQLTLHGTPRMEQFHQLIISLPLLEFYNQRYTERRIRRIDENFYDYCIGGGASLHVPSQRLPRELQYLSKKFYSGDVSGGIGESLFVYFMVHGLGINSVNIGHLRPLKKRGYVTPDFVITEDNGRLQALLNTNTYDLPVYAEVKSSASAIDRDRIKKGLDQIIKFIKNEHDYGLLFITQKNYELNTYNVYLVIVGR